MKSLTTLILSSFFLLGTILLNAQTPIMQWEQSFGGYYDGTGWETAYKVKNAIGGGYITCGYTIAADIPGGLTAVDGTFDGWVVKYDETGTLVWRKAYGGSGDDMLFSIDRSADGNGYILAGWTMSSDGDAGGGDHSMGKIWVVAINDTGAVQWHKCYGGTNYDGVLYPYIEDSYNQIIIKPVSGGGGYILSSPVMSDDGDVSSNHGGNDIWIARMNDTGAILWEKSYGGSGDEYLAGEIYQTNDGGYIAGGTTSSTDGDVTGHHGSFDYWLLKIDSTGILQWQKALGGTGSDWGQAGVCPAPDGGYIMAGSTLSADGDVTALGGGNSYTNWWVVKVDDNGVIVWNKSYGNIGQYTNDHAHAIKPAIGDGYLVAGRVSGATATGLEIGMGATVAGPIYGGHDGWLVKLNDTGAVVWEKNYGTEQNETFLDVLQNTDGSIVTTGQQANTLDSTESSEYLSQNWWTARFYACPAYTYLTDTMCTGSSYTFGGHTYTLAGIYNDTLIMSTTGCDSLIQLTLVLDSIPQPVITTSGNDLTTTGAYITYQWLKDGLAISGANATLFTPSISGNYQVVVTNARGCTDTSEVYNHTMTGITEPTSFTGMRLYPNPTTGMVTIELPQLKGEATVVLSSIDSRTIKTSTFQGTKLSIITAHLPSGIYLIRINTDEGSIVRKLIRE